MRPGNAPASAFAPAPAPAPAPAQTRTPFFSAFHTFLMRTAAEYQVPKASGVFFSFLLMERETMTFFG